MHVPRIFYRLLLFYTFSCLITVAILARHEVAITASCTQNIMQFRTYTNSICLVPPTFCSTRPQMTIIVRCGHDNNILYYPDFRDKATTGLCTFTRRPDRRTPACRCTRVVRHHRLCGRVGIGTEGYKTYCRRAI